MHWCIVVDNAEILCDTQCVLTYILFDVALSDAME